MVNHPTRGLTHEHGGKKWPGKIESDRKNRKKVYVSTKVYTKVDASFIFIEKLILQRATTPNRPVNLLYINV